MTLVVGGGIDTGSGLVGGNSNVGGPPTANGDAVANGTTLDATRAMHFVRIEGLPYAWFTGSPPSGWTAPSGYTYTRGLMHPGERSQSVSPTSPIASETLPAVMITDDGGYISSALAVNAAGDTQDDLVGGTDTGLDMLPAGTVASVRVGSRWSSSGSGFIGIEAISWTGKSTNATGDTTLTGVTRGLYPAVGRRMGRLHRVDSSRQQYPSVSTQATTHIGRMVSVYEVNYTSAGAVAPASTARVIFVGHLSGIAHEGNTWRLSLTSVMDFLRGSGGSVGARGTLNAQPYRAYATPDQYAGDFASLPPLALTMYFGQTDPATGTTIDRFSATVTGADATSRPTLITALRAAIVAARTAAGLSANYRWTVDNTGALGFLGVTGAVPASSTVPWFSFPGGSVLAQLLGYSKAGEAVAQTYLNAINTIAFAMYPPTPMPDIALMVSSSQGLSLYGAASSPTAMSFTLKGSSGTIGTQNDLVLGGTSSGSWLVIDGQAIVLATLNTTAPAAFAAQATVTATVAGFADPVDYAAPIPSATGTILPSAYRLITRALGDKTPLYVDQVWIPAGSDSSLGADSMGVKIAVGEFLLRCMLSSGSPGTNSTMYDLHPATWGVNLSPDIVDIPAWQALATQSNVAMRRYFFRESFSIVDILEEEAKLCGFYVAMVNGKITPRRWSLPATASAATTNVSALPALGSANRGDERPTTNRTTSFVINAASVSLNYDPLQKKYAPPTLEVAVMGSQGETGVVNKIDLQSHGIRATSYNGLDGELAKTLANAFTRYSREAPVITRGIDRSLSYLSPGDRVTLTEQSVPAVISAGYGVSAVVGEIVSIRYDWQSREGSVDVYLYPRYRDTILAADLDPSGSLTSYNGTIVVLDPIAAPGDTTAKVPYVVGDYVTITEADPVNPASPQSWTVLVDAVDQAAGTFTPHTSLTGYSSSVAYVTRPASYSGASATQQAKGSWIAATATQIVASVAKTRRIIP